jgi:hypothetical protein
MSTSSRTLPLLISLAILVSGSPAYADAKPIKSNFSNMKDLLASMKVKGIVCDSYRKTPAELVIEEGVCSIRGEEVLIDLWPINANYVGEFAKASLGIPKVNGRGKIYVFYSNNFIFTIDDSTVEKVNSKRLQVANLLQKNLGIKYRVGKT